MGASDPVAAHSFEDLQLTLNSTLIDSGSKAAQVMVHTYSVYAHLLSVKVKPAVGAELDGTYAERRLVTVSGLALGDDFGYKGIEMGIFQAPQHGRVDTAAPVVESAAVCRDPYGRRSPFSSRPALCVNYGVLYYDVGR